MQAAVHPNDFFRSLGHVTSQNFSSLQRPVEFEVRSRLICTDANQIFGARMNCDQSANQCGMFAMCRFELPPASIG